MIQQNPGKKMEKFRYHNRNSKVGNSGYILTPWHKVTLNEAVSLNSYKYIFIMHSILSNITKHQIELSSVPIFTCIFDNH